MSTAAYRLEFELEVASTSRMWHCGHAAETMSRSRLISTPQPWLPLGYEPCTPRLVDLLEAAVGGGARGQAVRGAVVGEVGLRRRVVEGIDDRHRLARAGGAGGQGVGALEVARPVAAGGRRGGLGLVGQVADQLELAVREARAHVQRTRPRQHRVWPQPGWRQTRRARRRRGQQDEDGNRSSSDDRITQTQHEPHPSSWHTPAAKSHDGRSPNRPARTRAGRTALLHGAQLGLLGSEAGASVFR